MRRSRPELGVVGGLGWMLPLHRSLYRSLQPLGEPRPSTVLRLQVPRGDWVCPACLGDSGEDIDHGDRDLRMADVPSTATPSADTPSAETPGASASSLGGFARHLAPASALSVGVSMSTPLAALGGVRVREPHSAHRFV